MLRLEKLRLSPVWNGLIVFLGAAASILASFMLSTEAYWRALDPHKTFACDVNAKLSCSEVADSWQAQLLHLPDGPVPNAFLGLIAFTIIGVIGVVYACKAKLPSWFEWCFRAGVLAALLFSSWLLQQSIFVIKAMCPWCLTMDVGMIFSMIGALRLWGASSPGEGTGGWFRFTRGLESLLVEVIIILAFGLSVFLYYML